MSILISNYVNTRIDKLPFEVVERKGIGHPDSLADAIAERASRYYSQYCLKEFGKLAHHWVDKVMLLGGQSDLGFGTGSIKYPYKVIFAGKAALNVGKHSIPAYDLFHKAAADVLSEILYNFDPKKYLTIEMQVSNYQGPGQGSSRYNPKSIDELFDLNKDIALSNDCNICTGYAPLSVLEQIVLSTEQYLSSKEYKLNNPDTGFDIKIVGTRKNDKFEIFVNIPLIAMLVPDHATYIKRINDIKENIYSFIKNKFKLEPELTVNPEKISGRSYLTVTGTVADTGDIGVVGRGNRINGLITPMRMMSIEASAGKNPADHTGKLHSILANQLASEIATITNKHTEVIITTWKEKPVNDPQDILISLEDYKENDFKDLICNLTDKALSNVGKISHDLIYTGFTLW